MLGKKHKRGFSFIKSNRQKKKKTINQKKTKVLTAAHITMRRLTS
jgi:hypothetical protein